MEVPSADTDQGQLQQEITEKLIAWNNGETDARDDVISAVYHELRRMAGRYLRNEAVGHSLQPTALVNEAYLRLIDQTQVTWQNRAHFFGVAAQMMRRILVDHARSKHREKRGGVERTLSLEEVLDIGGGKSTDLVALDEAMNELSEIDPRKSRVVELRFFGGLSVDETAAVLAVSPQTVLRDWKLAKAWLFQQLSESPNEL
jgi:RNA polymerase sigma-70 factor (ECF subfamily)